MIIYYDMVCSVSLNNITCFRQQQNSRTRKLSGKEQHNSRIVFFYEQNRRILFLSFKNAIGLSPHVVIGSKIEIDVG